METPEQTAERLLPCMKGVTCCTREYHSAACPAEYREAVAEAIRARTPQPDGEIAALLDRWRSCEGTFQRYPIVAELVAALEAEHQTRKQAEAQAWAEASNATINIEAARQLGYREGRDAAAAICDQLYDAIDGGPRSQVWGDGVLTCADGIRALPEQPEQEKR